MTTDIAGRKQGIHIVPGAKQDAAIPDADSVEHRQELPVVRRASRSDQEQPGVRAPGDEGERLGDEAVVLLLIEATDGCNRELILGKLERRREASSVAGHRIGRRRDRHHCRRRRCGSARIHSARARAARASEQ